VLEALVALSQSQVAALLARGASLETQSFGLIGLNTALGAGVLAAQEPILGASWWAPLPGLAASIVAAGGAISIGKYDLGPDPVVFYNSYNQVKVDDEGLAQLLVDLRESTRNCAGALRLKTLVLTAAVGLLAATVGYSAAVIGL
jgi:hypothetical protein